MTRDAGKTWTNLTANLPNLPPWGSVRSIVPSRYDAATAYLTVDFHQVNNRDPFVYKTTDYGKTFKAITNGIPKSMLSYAHWICEDPVRRGLLYLGTENAIYVSFDDGENWQPLQNDLPHAPGVRHHRAGALQRPGDRDLRARLLDSGRHHAAPAAHRRRCSPPTLICSRRGRRTASGHITAPSTPYDDPTIGENPRYGASINYYLKGAGLGRASRSRFWIRRARSSAR